MASDTKPEINVEPNQDQPMAIGMDGKPIGPLFGNGPEKSVASDHESFSWTDIIKRARRGAALAVIGLVLIAAILSSLVYWWLASRSNTRQPDGQKSSTELKSLPSSSLGRDGELLTVSAATTFRNKVDIDGDVDVTGKLNTGTPLSVSALQVAGATTLSAADVKSTLNVEGASTLQGNVNVGNLLTVAGNLNVVGNSSFGGTLTGGNLSVRNQTVAGTLTLGGHVVSGGATPSISAGPAVGGAGTVSISGNDRAGTVTINTGQSPPVGALANITFRSPYASTPRVTISPIGASSGSLQYYLNRTTGGFTISTLSSAPQGTSFSFDYIVEQ